MKPLIADLQAALDDWLMDCQFRRLRARTVETYRMHVGGYMVYVGEAGRSAISKDDARLIRAYLASREHWAEATTAAAFRSLRVAYGFWTKNQYIERNPFDSLRMPRVSKEPKTGFSESDIRALFAAADCHRDRALILFLLDTGARATEAISINLADVDLATGWTNLNTTKTRVPRVVYLGEQALRWMVLYLRQRTGLGRPDVPLWASERTGERLTRTGLFQAIRRIGRRAGVSPSGLHRFRRTFAFSFLRNGGDVYALKRIMGHTSLEMLQEYLDDLTNEVAAREHHDHGPGDRITLRK